MTEAEKRRALVDAQIEQADEALQAASLLLKNALYRDSISRSYYAMFHAASALLLTRGLGSSKHKGVVSLFDREFVRPGVVTKQMSIWLHDAFEARLAADYGKVPLDFPAVAKATREKAEQFMVQIRTVLLQPTDTPVPE